MRDRVSRKGADRYQIQLPANETRVLRDLVVHLREQLLASTDDPVVRRLFPPAYANDPERDAGYQVLTRDELLNGRLQALETVEVTLDKEEIDREELTAWMQSLTSLRLVLGTRLDVDEESQEFDPSDPLAPLFAVYEFLGWLLSQAVDALSRDLPPPVQTSET